jgi:hypothetical protein
VCRERFRTFTGWPVALKMAAAFRSTKPVQPGQSIGLLNGIELPTATRDQGAGSEGVKVGVGVDVDVGV